MAVRDPQTEWLRVQMYRQMTPEERVEIALRMRADALEIARAAIRDRKPGITPEEVEWELRCRITYMIVGSFASTYWGRPRTTHDADLAVEIPPDRAGDLSRPWLIASMPPISSMIDFTSEDTP